MSVNQVQQMMMPLIPFIAYIDINWLWDFMNSIGAIYFEN